MGGGINGCGVARDAARRGLRVALVEQDDWGAGTTRWSTRLIHGGLRYLEHGEVRLVRESLVERERLLRTAAHLVRPLHLVIPVRRTSPFGPPRLRAGMVAYDLLSPASRSTATACSGAPRPRPSSRASPCEGLRGAAVYADAQVPLVERLCVENVLDAAAHGAVCLNHTRVDGLLREDGAGRRRALHRRARRAHGRRCARRSWPTWPGPWVDARAPARRPRAGARLGGTRGCHLVLPVWDGAPREALYVAARSDGRAFEICRWRRWMLVGTTDEPFDGDPRPRCRSSRGRSTTCWPRSTPSSRAPAWAATTSCSPPAASGRCCARTGKAPGAITRAHTIADGADEGLPGLLSAIGGKVTTYRQLAEEVVDRVVAATRPAAARRATRPTARCRARRTSGGDPVLWRERTILEPWPAADVARETAEHLVDAYGTRAAAVVGAGRRPSRRWRAPLVPGRPGAGRGGRRRRRGGGRPHGRGRRLPAHAGGPDAGRRPRRAVARGAAVRGPLRLGRRGGGGRAHAAANRDFRKGLEPLPAPDAPAGARARRARPA